MTKPFNFFMTITAIFFVGLNSSIQAHNGPITQSPTYQEIPDEIPYQRVALPDNCKKSAYNLLFRSCERDENLEIGLEREYWAHIQNLNFASMKHLLSRILSYTHLSNSNYKARLIRLVTFGKVFLAQETSGLSFDKIPLLIEARTTGALSNLMQPNNVNTLSLIGFIDANLKHALTLSNQADRIIEDLLQYPGTQGDYGLEAEIVGAMALTYTTDKKRIQRGLSILNMCSSYNCIRTTSLAPFKQVGILLTIAEAEIALGNILMAQQAIDMAMDFSENQRLSTRLIKQLKAASAQVISGDYATAAPKLKGLGLYRLPAGPSQNALACAICHSGAYVPEHYYRWK